MFNNRFGTFSYCPKKGFASVFFKFRQFYWFVSTIHNYYDKGYRKSLWLLLYGCLLYLTYLNTPWSRVLLEKLTVFHLVKKFPAFYGAWRFITAFTSAHHLSLSWASSIQAIPLHPTFWGSILILSSHLCLVLPSGLFPSGFPTKTLYTSLPSPIHTTCPTYLILLDFITCTILGEQYRSLSSS